MPSARLVYRNPFQTGSRPYLALHVTGINGTSGTVTGLVDSGADFTQLPMGYASLMGYDATTLQAMTVGTAGTPVQVMRATKPCVAYVPGLHDLTMELLPAFSMSDFVLWGRTDFMATFGVTIREKDQEFEIHW